MSRTVHFLVPEGFDDPARPSGGNHYDVRIRDGLAVFGWQVQTWPVIEPSQVVANLADDAIVLVDGMIASAHPDVFATARRLRLVVLIHMLTANAHEDEVFSAARAILTTSQWTRQKVLAEYHLSPDRVHVAYPGVDAAEVATGTSTGSRLLCVAAVAEHKGHDVLIAALERIAGLSWHCTFAGPLDRDPAYVDRLRKQLHSARLADRVTFTGVLDAAALALEYAAADLVVLASWGETYGMALSEALSRGIPVVATDVGGIPEALGTATDDTVPGLFFPAGDAPALAAQLTRWLQDVDLRHRLRTAARDRRESLPTWHATARQVAEVLAGVAG